MVKLPNCSMVESTLKSPGVKNCQILFQQTFVLCEMPKTNQQINKSTNKKTI